MGTNYIPMERVEEWYIHLKDMGYNILYIITINVEKVINSVSIA